MPVTSTKVRRTHAQDPACRPAHPHFYCSGQRPRANGGEARGLAPWFFYGVAAIKSGIRFATLGVPSPVTASHPGEAL